MSRRGQPAGITSLAVLRYVRDNPGEYICDITRALELSYSVIHRTVCALLANGYLRDGEAYEITLTKKGREFYSDRMAWITGEK